MNLTEFLLFFWGLCLFVIGVAFVGWLIIQVMA